MTSFTADAPLLRKNAALPAPSRAGMVAPARAVVNTCGRYGAGLVCSEMVSCAGLEHRNERTLGYLRVAGDEHPLAIQIFGSDPPVMAEAARMVASAGADIVDVNFGCPVRKVTKTGAGATLLDDPDRACRIVAAMADAVSVPVSVKMRRGLENGSR